MAFIETYFKSDFLTDWADIANSKDAILFQFQIIFVQHMKNNTCPIWGTPAEIDKRDDSSWHVNSSRAGGRYIISDSWYQRTETLNEKQKILVTSWLVSQRLLGDIAPRISDSLEMGSIRDPSVSQRAENLLRYINSQLSSIGDIFRPPRNLQNLDKNDPLRALYAEMLAWSASTELEEVDYLLICLASQGLIEPLSERTRVTVRCRLTIKGHTHLANLGHRIIDSTQAFVAMWFDSSLDDAYYKGIKPAIEECGYSAKRIDQTEHLNKIDDQIMAEIRRSKFVVVDLTEGEVKKEKDGAIKGGTRGSVYYEAGFAHGLSIPVIFTCWRNSLGMIHFDIQQYPCIFWSTPEELKSRLAQRISANLGDSPYHT